MTPARPRSIHQAHFTNLIGYRCIDAGHNTPQENPAEFARAISDVRAHL